MPRFFLQFLLVITAFAPFLTTARETCCNPVVHDVNGPTSNSEKKERVIGLADLHGDFRMAVYILTELGIMKNECNVDELYVVGGFEKCVKWEPRLGYKTYFVQTGDVMDRLGQGEFIIELLIHLKAKAEEKGDEVRAVTGNHEAMILQKVPNFLHYTFDPKTTAQFYPDCVDASTAETLNAKTLKKCKYFRDMWLRDCVPDRSKPRSCVGNQYRYLVTGTEAMTKVGDYLFMHASVSIPLLNHLEKQKKTGEEGVQYVNAGFEDALANSRYGMVAQRGECDEGSTPDTVHELFMENCSPVWRRVLRSNGKHECSGNKRAKEMLGFEKMFMGHDSPGEVFGVETYCDYIMMGDVQISEYYDEYYDEYYEENEVEYKDFMQANSTFKKNSGQTRKGVARISVLEICDEKLHNLFPFVDAQDCVAPPPVEEPVAELECTRRLRSTSEDNDANCNSSNFWWVVVLIAVIICVLILATCVFLCFRRRREAPCGTIEITSANS